MTYTYRGDADLESSTDRVMVIGAVLLFLLAVGFPLYRWFEPGGRTDARKALAAGLVTEGASVWKNNCASCHGAKGEGDVGPSLNSKQFLTSATDEQARLLISVGVPGSKMGAYSLDHGGSLTSQQIKSVVSYIRSWEPKAPDNPDWRKMVQG